MPRYNIALLPVDASLQEQLARLAKTFFEKIADGYLLGENALAHVTLLQFHAASDQTALSTYNSWPERNAGVIKLSFVESRIRPGTAEHTGQVWAEFLVEKQSALLRLQESCCRQIEHTGLKPLTFVQGYSPHLSLARLQNAPHDGKLPSKDSFQHPIPFRLALGQATESGVFIKELALI